MNGAIRKVGYALILLVLILVGQLTYLQVVDASRLADDPNNIRKFLRDFNRARGEILTADGQVVAKSVPAPGELKYQRVYPTADLFSIISGYQSFVVGNTGVEASYNGALTGRDRGLDFESVLSGKDNTGNVVLAQTMAAQQAARDALGGQKGSIVAIDVKTGAIAAMYSNPSFDPNALADHNTDKVNFAFFLLNTNPDHPALARGVPREVPAGIDVQGRDNCWRDRDRHRAARSPVSVLVGIPSAGHQHLGRQLRRVELRRRDAHREPAPVLQCDVRRPRLRTGA